MPLRAAPGLMGRHSPNLPWTRTQSTATTRKALLLCGLLSSLYYVAMNVYVPIQWDGYSFLSQVLSELSAVDAPTRALWVRMGIVHTILVIAFGIGVFWSAGNRRILKIVGGLLIVDAGIGPFWPPMHPRGVEPTVSDTLHIVFTAVWLVVILVAMVLSAAALGRRFRLYTFATLAAFLVFGTLTAVDAPRLAANLPTPWIGLWERINIAAAMLWIALLAVALWRRSGAQEAAASGS